jgi:SAM-dependent methyltransferase
VPALPDYAAINRVHWTIANSRYTDGSAGNAWADATVAWGVWQRPDADLNALPDIREKDVVELGCGTGDFGARLKRAGARRVVGVDVTPAQLATARRLNDETGLGLEFLEANAEEVPLPDASFDVAVSEYGASIWCDPYQWIPEAARLLRPGGELVFLACSTLSTLCSPDIGPSVVEQLQRPQRGLHKLEWPSDENSDGPSVEFSIGHGEMFALLRQSGFTVIDFIEIYAPDDAIDHPFYTFVPVHWARKWPAEEIWRARKNAP